MAGIGTEIRLNDGMTGVLTSMYRGLSQLVQGFEHADRTISRGFSQSSFDSFRENMVSAIGQMAVLERSYRRTENAVKNVFNWNRQRSVNIFEQSGAERFKNEKLEKQQKKLQQEINKMVQSKEVMERNIHTYDEDIKWQLAEPGVLMSAKAYRDKKALPLVEKLKEIVKSLTIKCVQLTEQGKKLTIKVNGQQTQISRLTDKVMEQSDTIDRLQEKATDLGRLERHLGREHVERSKALEQAERANKRPKRSFEVSR